MSISYHFPDRLGVWCLVLDGNNFDGCQFHGSIQQKDDRLGGGILQAAELGSPLPKRTMTNLNRRGAKSVSIKVKAEAAEHDDERNLKHGFLCHGFRRLGFVSR